MQNYKVVKMSTKRKKAVDDQSSEYNENWLSNPEDSTTVLAGQGGRHDRLPRRSTCCDQIPSLEGDRKTDRQTNQTLSEKFYLGGASVNFQCIAIITYTLITGMDVSLQLNRPMISAQLFYY
jgi:hypothetical protein